jgi:hypothetical protein
MLDSIVRSCCRDANAFSGTSADARIRRQAQLISDLIAYGDNPDDDQPPAVMIQGHLLHLISLGRDVPRSCPPPLGRILRRKCQSHAQASNR